MKTYGSLLNGIIRKYLINQNQDIEECFADVLVPIWFHIDSFDASKNEFKQWHISKLKVDNPDANGDGPLVPVMEPYQIEPIRVPLK